MDARTSCPATPGTRGKSTHREDAGQNRRLGPMKEHSSHQEYLVSVRNIAGVASSVSSLLSRASWLVRGRAAGLGTPARGSAAECSLRLRRDGCLIAVRRRRSRRGACRRWQAGGPAGDRRDCRGVPWVAQRGSGSAGRLCAARRAGGFTVAAKARPTTGTPSRQRRPGRRLGAGGSSAAAPSPAAPARRLHRGGSIAVAPARWRRPGRRLSSRRPHRGGEVRPACRASPRPLVVMRRRRRRRRPAATAHRCRRPPSRGRGPSPPSPGR